MIAVWCFCEHYDRHHHSSLSSESLSNKLIIIKITTVIIINIIKIPTMLIKNTTVIIIKITTMLIKMTTLIIKITTVIIIKSTTCPLRASPVCSLNCSIRLFCGAACCWKNALSNLKMSFAHCRLFPQSIELFLL